jgi:hypothetical protein
LFFCAAAWRLAASCSWIFLETVFLLAQLQGLAADAVLDALFQRRHVDIVLDLHQLLPDVHADGIAEFLRIAAQPRGGGIFRIGGGRARRAAGRDEGKAGERDRRAGGFEHGVILRMESFCVVAAGRARRAAPSLPYQGRACGHAL